LFTETSCSLTEKHDFLSVHYLCWIYKHRGHHTQKKTRSTYACDVVAATKSSASDSIACSNYCVSLAV